MNSVKKHLEDHNKKKRLSKRIESTIKELLKLSEKMKRRGYLKTCVFIKSHSRLMVTFAKIALSKRIRIPYTSNAIERLMGEISKRCKHKWMHWSTRGLENICSGYSLRDTQILPSITKGSGMIISILQDVK